MKKADKGTTTIIMSREQKIKEGQILLNDLGNYRPLDKPMADKTAEKKNSVIITPGMRLIKIFTNFE